MEMVSVIMPCFNDGQYIGESIDSVLKQTYDDIELIIVNDGSTEKETIDTLSNIVDKRIRIIYCENLGPSGARNLGIEAARGKYILPLDADDTMDASYIAKAVDILSQNEQTGAVYCEADLFGAMSGKWNLPSYSLEHMLLDNIVFVSALFRKEDWAKVGGFSTELSNGMEDYDFWLALLEIDKVIIQIPEILFHYRIKNKSRTTAFNADINTVKETYRNIYYRHQSLYIKHLDIYAVVMREALIDKIFDNRMLLKSVDMVEFLNKYPWCKKIFRKLVSIFLGVH